MHFMLAKHSMTRKQVKGRKRLDEILIETGVSEEEYRLIKAGKRRMDLTKLFGAWHQHRIYWGGV